MKIKQLKIIYYKNIKKFQQNGEYKKIITILEYIKMVKQKL